MAFFRVVDFLGAGSHSEMETDTTLILFRKNKKVSSVETLHKLASTSVLTHDSSLGT